MMRNTAPSTLRRAIIAGIGGNVMEWYDFAVYGYFATVIGRIFSRRKMLLLR
jgi:MHS family proline/betaine transporter-like MFS transporter